MAPDVIAYLSEGKGVKTSVEPADDVIPHLAVVLRVVYVVMCCRPVEVLCALQGDAMLANVDDVLRGVEDNVHSLIVYTF
jgi:hypothetical protein